MIPIEQLDNEDEDKKFYRERYWIDQLKPNLNVQKPGRTKAEWRQENIEYVKQQAHDYYEQNKERFIEYSKE